MKISLQTVGGIAGALLAVMALFLALAPAQAQQSAAPSGAPHAMLQLKDGMVDIELLPKVAPETVKRIITLADQGFYDGLKFHRVITGFMAQTGDPTGTGAGGSKLADLKAEFSGEPFVRGTVGMARAADPDSANSQFFIVTGDASWLNGQYTLFGKVVSGMQYVDAIKAGDRADNGMVADPDKIVSMKIVYK